MFLAVCALASSALKSTIPPHPSQTSINIPCKHRMRKAEAKKKPPSQEAEKPRSREANAVQFLPLPCPPQGSRADVTAIQTVISDSFKFEALPLSVCPYSAKRCVPMPGVEFQARGRTRGVLFGGFAENEMKGFPWFKWGFVPFTRAIYFSKRPPMVRSHLSKLTLAPWG